MIVYRDVNNLTLYVAVQESGAQFGAAAKPAFTAHALPPPPA
jgi:hypothetical protein